MHGGPGTRGRSRWWLSGAAALVVHGAAWMLCPCAPSAQLSAQEDVASIWMTVSGDAAPSASGPAVEAAPEAAPRLFARAPEGALRRTEHVAKARVTRVRHDERLAEVALQPTGAAVGEQSDDGLAGAAADMDALLAAGAGAAPTGTSAGGLSAGGTGAAVKGPGLLTLPSPCRGFFPATAQVDRGAVQISVHVDDTGHARLHRLLMEMPRGQGFGAAAHACAAALRFVPAVNGQGIAVAGEAKLELTFSRS